MATGRRASSITPRTRRLGEDNCVLVARARQHYVRDFPGPLSIKSVVSGSVIWKTGKRELLVDESSLLVLNDGERYSMNIDSHRPVETCCVFFKKAFVESVFRSSTSTDASLLDDHHVSASLPFISRLHAGDSRIKARMQTIHRVAQERLPELEEQFLLLARDLVSLYQETHWRSSNIPTAKASTRRELFARLERAREYIHANLDRHLTLEEVAREACLSLFHFHRLFKQVFGETPHRYMTRLRMARTRNLLKRGEIPMVEICENVGFESLGSFASLCKKSLGMTPGAFRRLAAQRS